MKPLHCPSCGRRYWMDGVCCGRLTKECSDPMTVGDLVWTVLLFGSIAALIFLGLGA